MIAVDCGSYWIDDHLMFKYYQIVFYYHRYVTNKGMWKFKSAWDSDGHPLLHSLNDNIGRQTWVYDPNAGSRDDIENIKALQEAFRKNRRVQKHSSDELLRYAATRVILVYCIE